MKYLLVLLAVQSAGWAAWDFIDKDGDALTFDQVASPSDLKQEEALFVGSFAEAYKAFSVETLGVKDKEAFLHAAFADAREDFENGKGILVAAKNGEELVGFVEFIKTENPGEYYVAQLAVSPQYWQKGIGRELVFSITKLANDVQHFVVIGRRINARGKGFYQHIGFTESPYMHPGYDPKKYIGFEYHL